MIRFALLVLLTACNGSNGDDTGDDTAACTSDCDDDGFTEAEGDCDDDDATVFPGATETYYDGVDQNCDELSDDDKDVDGFDAEAEGGDDCNDEDAAIHPGATETYYDGVDQDCNGLSDDDADGDTYDAVAEGGDDCDDTKASVHPGADELCSTTWDDDCEGGANEADAIDAPTWYADTDTDGHGDPTDTLVQCTQPEGYLESSDDCNGDEGTVYPDAEDVVCDGFDNDCDPLTFEPPVVRINGSETEQSLLLALATADPADVITLCEGKHTGTSLAIGVPMTLTGLGDARVTVIEQTRGETPTDDPSPVLTVTGVTGDNDAVTIEKLTLTQGEGAEVGNDRVGGGLFVNDGSHAELVDVAIVSNETGFGSGIYVGDGGSLALTRVLVADNWGDDAAAFVYPLGGGLYLSQTVQVTLEDVTIDNNRATLGGGVYMEDGVKLDGIAGENVISNNRTTLNGGGIHLTDGADVSNVDLIDNIAENSGGGIHATESAAVTGIVTLTDMLLDGNGCTLLGGGLDATGIVLATDVDFIGNLAGADGANMHVSGSATSVTLNSGSVLSGVLGSGRGGGASMYGGAIHSVGVNWGIGAEDNESEDIWMDMARPQLAGVACLFGVDETFDIVDVLDANCPP